MSEKDKVDKAADIQFREAIVKSIPESGVSKFLLGGATGYALGKAIKGAVKRYR